MRHEDICLHPDPADHSELQALIANRNTPHKLGCRAEIVLATAGAHGTFEIMRHHGRIWADAGLKPRLVRGFNVLHGPWFEESLVALYRDPPDCAAVPFVDGKPLFRAPDRIRPFVGTRGPTGGTLTRSRRAARLPRPRI